MVFSNLIFLYLFLPVCLIFYFLCQNIRAKNAVLIVFSLIFYAWGEPVYLLLMIASVAVNWGFGLLIERRRKKVFLILALVLDLGCLAVFKYAGFFVENLNALFRISLTVPQIPLPIGISFYTFQALSYTVDVWRGDVPAQRSFAKLLLYISLFPQLVAGPIVRYEDVAHEVRSRSHTWENLARGLRRFIIGLSKKLLIADVCGSVVAQVYGADASILDSRAAWLGAVCYLMQIYFDFSGYSDMAIGLGLCFGFHFRENFNYPYISSSIKEFWRRWHISLSTWFREYLYIPLGGNRKGTAKTYRNKLIVFFFTGLWHGANWTFIVWGLWHGFFIVAEDLVAKLTGKDRHSRNSKRRAAGIAKHLYTLLVVLIGFVIFRADTMSQAVAMVAAMFSGVHATAQTGLLLAQCMTPLTLCALAAGVVFSTPVLPAILHRTDALTQNAQRAVRVLGGAVLLMLLVTDILHLSAASYVPFIYFQF